MFAFRSCLTYTMKKENFSIFLLLLNILCCCSQLTKSQEIGDDTKHSFTGQGATICQKYQDITRRYKSAESDLNDLKSKCPEEYNAFSQDISEILLATGHNCIIRNINYVMKRLEYLEKLIGRISEYCKSYNNRTKASNAEDTSDGISETPRVEAATPSSISSLVKTFLLGSLLIHASPLSSIDIPFAWSRCYFKIEVFEGNTQITNFNVTVIYRTDLLSDTVARFQEYYISRDEVISAFCKTDVPPLKAYIGVEKDSIKIHVDADNSGISSSAKSFISYVIMEDGSTISAEMQKANSGPFYHSFSGSFQNIFRFQLYRTDYSLIVLNMNMQEAIINNVPGKEIFYPPLNSFLLSEVGYRTCLIKIKAINANNNFRFRLISRNHNSSLLGIHEKGLTKGAACIEYRCSVQDPDFDLSNSGGGNDFYRYDTSYTVIKIIPIGQICSVIGESCTLRTFEQINMNLTSPRSNIGNTYFEAFVPEHDLEGIYSHSSDTFSEIPEARNHAVKKCNTGKHFSFSMSADDMNPDVGLATTFSCL